MVSPTWYINISVDVVPQILFSFPLEASPEHISNPKDAAKKSTEGVASHLKDGASMIPSPTARLKPALEQNVMSATAFDQVHTIQSEI